MKQTVRVTLPDGTSDRFVLEEERSDGSILLRPDTSYAAMSERAGGREVSAAEFEAFIAECGDEMLPSDGEG